MIVGLLKFFGWDAGKYVHIVFVEGKKGRIVEPLNGWVSMRKNKKAILTQVFNNFEAPTVILSNLDSSLTREKDVLNFLRKQDCRPTRCIWQKKDDFVTVFFTKHKDASKLVRGSNAKQLHFLRKAYEMF